MATLFNRLYAYHKRNNVPLLKIEDRLLLGKEMIKYFRKCGMKGYYYINKVEPDFKGKVIYYPKEFTPIMDKIILDFYNK